MSRLLVVEIVAGEGALQQSLLDIGYVIATELMIG